MRPIRCLLLVLLATACSSAQSAPASRASIPKVIKFSGTAPLGVSSATFAIYDSQDSSAPLWLETQVITADENGHYSALLGSTTAEGLPAGIFATTEARWIGVKIGDAQETLRSLLVSVPYALKAADAETLGGKPLSAFVLSESSSSSVSTTTGATKTKSKRLLATGKAPPETNGTGDMGTQSHLAKFTTTGSTLGDSTLVEVGGRLGIGTTSPNYPLELVGPNVELLQRNADPTSYAGMRFYNDQNSNVRALEIDYSGSAYPSILAIGGPVGESASVATTGAFPLTLGTNNTARVTISGSGNVGIGTNSPAFPLELVGGNIGFLQRNPNPSSYTGMRFYNDQNANVRALEIDYAGSAYPSVLAVGGPVGESASLATTGAFPLTLGTNNTARVTISGSGNVGIGTNSPVAKLDVSQTAAGSGSFSPGVPPPSAVHGDTTATSGFITGILGTASTVDGFGVLGENLASGASSGNSAGVRGITANTSDKGTGVWGDALETSGDNVGVFGRSASDTGTGVQGQAISMTGDAAGVFGTSASNAGSGVFGEVNSATAASSTLFPAGVYGRADGAGAAGLFDVASSSANILVGRLGTSNVFRVDSTGKVWADGGSVQGGADFAESVSVLEQKSAYEPGDVIAIDATGVRRFAKAAKPYSTLVAGIYSTKPGVLATPHTIDDQRVTSQEIPLAVVGIVPCKVTNENGKINTGDLLVSSSTAGYAMKGTDRNRMTGAIVGKALQALHEKNGVIEVLVSLQ